MSQHINASAEAGKAFYQAFRGKEPLAMLNLLRFRKDADYSEHLKLKPSENISGREAYRLYMNHTMPHLQAAGGRVLFFGSSQHFLIGPEQEQWDAVLLVEHRSVDAFLGFAQNEEYLKTAGHRKAALLDSRLLPVEIHDFKQEILTGYLQ